eukprot:s62_g16.t1
MPAKSRVSGVSLKLKAFWLLLCQVPLQEGLTVLGPDYIVQSYGGTALRLVDNCTEVPQVWVYTLEPSGEVSNCTSPGCVPGYDATMRFLLQLLRTAPWHDVLGFLGVDGSLHIWSLAGPQLHELDSPSVEVRGGSEWVMLLQGRLCYCLVFLASPDLGLAVGLCPNLSQSMAPPVTTWRLQLIVIGSMLSLVSQVTFIASQPKMPDRAMSALRKAQDLESEGQSDVGRLEEIVEALRQESLEACLSASENDSEALERCRVLSYELNSAEQSSKAFRAAGCSQRAVSRVYKRCGRGSRSSWVLPAPRAAMADRHGPFYALVQKLEEQHEKEVADLKATIGRLEAAVNAKHSDSGDSSKATLGPRVVRPSPITTFNIREPLPGGEQAVPKEHNASASEDVASIDGPLDNEPDLLKVPLQIPPPSPGAGPPGSPKASDPVSPNSIRSMTGSFSLMSPRPGESEEPPEEEAKTLIQKIKKFVRSDTFDLVVGLLVTLNFLTMAMELQYAGLQSGYVLSIRFFDQPSASAWPWAVDFFQVMRSIFLVFFTSEILLRFLFLRAAFFKTPFNVIDFIALLASLVELFSWNLPVDPTLLRMSSSGLTLVWSLLFLLVIQLIAAMIVCFMDVHEPEERRQEVYKYYGTFTIAVLTLFEVFFANWAPACRVLVENISEWYSLLFLIYRCGIGFAVINVVNAVFVQQTMQVAKGDEEVLLLEKQKAEEKYMKNVGKIFQTLDTSGDGLLSWAEFEVLLQDRKLKFLLDKLEIAAGDLKTLFDLLDDTGDGEISVEEFLEGITRFKGAAKSLDIGQLLLRSRRLEKGMLGPEDPQQDRAISLSVNECRGKPGRSARIELVNSEVATTFATLSQTVTKLVTGNGSE